MMKMYLGGVAATVGVLAMFAAAPVDAQSSAMRATIPFAFAAGSETLPPGQYEVRRLNQSPNVMHVRGPRASVLVMSETGASTRSWQKTRLVFHRYGNAYFLRTISFGGYRAFTLPESKGERETALRIARANGPDETVSVEGAFD